MSRVEYEIERAAPAEADAIRVMQARSMRVLGRSFYAPAAIESLLRAPGTLDDAVLAEGHYFVARDRTGRIIGSAGWSQLQPGYARGGPALPSAADLATVRGVFVDPDCARQGIGAAMMGHVELDSARAGITTLMLTATLSGVTMYTRLGYLTTRSRTIVLADDAHFGVFDMGKELVRRAA
jgi:GNAT superfamily N-acetyltransferase